MAPVGERLLDTRSTFFIPAAPPVVQPADTALLRGVTATLADGAPRICSIDGKPDFVLSVLDTLDAELNKALCHGFKAKTVVRACF